MTIHRDNEFNWIIGFHTEWNDCATGLQVTPLQRTVDAVESSSLKRELQMMKQPTEDDFTVAEVLESGATVLFEPTHSFYTFYRLADPNDIDRFGPLSPEPDNIRHAGPSADTGDS
jgi:hypothetical protein